MLARLGEGQANVSEIAEPFLAQMSLPAVTKHLKVLEKAGLAFKDQVERLDRAGKKHQLLLYEITPTEYYERQWPEVWLEQPY